MDEIEANHPDHIINGLEIREPHFFGFEGSNGTHHSIIEFVGPKYGYDNIIIGTKGAAKTVYLLNDGTVKRAIRERDIKPLASDNFIVLGSRLYHIPTAKSTNISERSFELVERVPNVFDFKNKDKQIEWTGSSFETYEDVDPEEDETSDSSDRSYEDIPSTDLREAPQTTNEKYRSLLRRIVDSVSWVKNKQEADQYINGGFEISESEKKQREFQEIKSMYASGEITIREFERRVEQFLIEDEEYIWTTGEYSDTQLSDFSESGGVEVEEEDDEDRDMNSAFNW